MPGNPFLARAASAGCLSVGGEKVIGAWGGVGAPMVSAAPAVYHHLYNAMPSDMAFRVGVGYRN